MTLEGGYSYLIKEDDNQQENRSFVEKAQFSGKVLHITRHAPELLEDMGTDKTSSESYIWLTFNKGPNCIDPTNITRLSIRIQEFLKENKNATILFDGLEYLASQNDFSTILHFIQLVNDKIMLSDSKLILSINPFAFKPKELAQIEREMESLDDR
ncbi:MAG: DUF835 domain-containing protein [Candidatus Thorarchaeota archaeon]